jgi:hypothetical protein
MNSTTDWHLWRKEKSRNVIGYLACALTCRQTPKFREMIPELGLIHVRVPTWLPFRVQIYFNGHSWPACQSDAAGISY